jgi:hypothetical protein
VWYKETEAVSSIPPYPQTSYIPDLDLPAFWRFSVYIHSIQSSMQLFSLFLLLLTTCFGRRRPHTSCCHLGHRASVKRFVSLQFLNLRHSVGLLGRVMSPSQVRYLTQTQNKHKQTSMHRVRFEPTIPAFEQAKTVHALDRSATVTGYMLHTSV